MTTDTRLITLAQAVRDAADMLDSEEHRYVERYAPCPDGCRYEYADAALVDGHPVALDGPLLVRVDGPTDCKQCDDGTVEDEDAPWLDEHVALLRAAADLIAGDAATASTAP